MHGSLYENCQAVIKLSSSCHQAVVKLPNTKLSITHSFFELQSPDFAWKFVCKMSSCRQAVVKLSSSCRQIQKYKNTQNTQNNSPAPAINTQKEKKKQKDKKMQKDKKNKETQKEKNM